MGHQLIPEQLRVYPAAGRQQDAQAGDASTDEQLGKRRELRPQVSSGRENGGGVRATDAFISMLQTGSRYRRRKQEEEASHHHLSFNGASSQQRERRAGLPGRRVEPTVRRAEPPSWRGGAVHTKTDAKKDERHRNFGPTEQPCEKRPGWTHSMQESTGPTLGGHVGVVTWAWPHPPHDTLGQKHSATSCNMI